MRSCFRAPLVLPLVVLLASSRSACGRGCPGGAAASASSSSDGTTMTTERRREGGWEEDNENSRPSLAAGAIREAATSKLSRLLARSRSVVLSGAAGASTTPVATDVLPSVDDRDVVVAKFTQYLEGLPVEGAELAMHIDTRDGSVVALEGKVHSAGADSPAPSRGQGCEGAVEKAFETLPQRRSRRGVWSSPCDDAAVVGVDGRAHLAYKRVRSYDIDDSDVIFASRLDGSLVAVHSQSYRPDARKRRGLATFDPDFCALERGIQCNRTVGCIVSCNNTCDGRRGISPTCRLCRGIGKTCVRSTQCCQGGSRPLSCQNNFCWPVRFQCPVGPPSGNDTTSKSHALATVKSGLTCQSRADCCGGSAGQFQLTCDGTSSSNKKCVVCKAAKQGPCERSSQCCKGLTCKSKRCLS